MIFITISILAILVFLSGLFNGRMDHIKEFQLDKNSYLKKWKLDNEGKEQPYIVRSYYFGLHTPEYVEAFPYSSTMLVFTTDPWHRNKWCMNRCVDLIIIVPFILHSDFDWFLLPIAFITRGIGFQITHKN